jgi:hypothetical protein
VGAAYDSVELAQDLRQGLSARLAGSAGAGGEGRQADLFARHAPSSRTPDTSIRVAFVQPQGKVVIRDTRGSRIALLPFPTRSW